MKMDERTGRIPQRLLFVPGAVLCCVLFVLAGPLVAAAAPTAEDLERAPVLQEEKLLVFGSANVKGPIPVLNPDGKTYDLLLNYGDYANILVGESLVVVDTGDGSVTLHRTPAGVSFHSVLLGGRVVGPDGKLYMMVRDDRGERLMTVWVYDPASNTLKALGAPSKFVPSPGGVTPMTLADDGSLYGAGTGRDRRIAAYSLDPKTGTFRDFGLLGPPRADGLRRQGPLPRLRAQERPAQAAPPAEPCPRVERAGRPGPGWRRATADAAAAAH